MQVPKDGATDATGLRPIGLLASVYRLWAAARMGEVRLWQISADSDTLGGRVGSSAEEAVLEAAIFADDA